MVCTYLSCAQHDDAINCHLFSRAIANVNFSLIYGTRDFRMGGEVNYLPLALTPNSKSKQESTGPES